MIDYVWLYIVAPLSSDHRGFRRYIILDLSISLWICLFLLLFKCIIYYLSLFSSEVLRLCRDTFRCGEKFNYSIRCLWLNRAWHVQAGMAELTRFLYATVQRHSTKAQYKGTVQGHSTKAQYKGTVQGHSTKAQYKGTIKGHSTKTQYKGTIQGHNKKAQYKDTVQRHNTKALYKGTIQRHSTQSQYKGTVQRQCTKSQYIDTIQRQSTQAQYKCKQQ